MKWRWLILIIGVLLVALVIKLNQPGDFSVTFFDVGQGDAALVLTSARQAILIDGGPDREIMNKLGRTLPWQKHSIDLVILSHPHADHLTGLLSVLQQYQVKQILMSGAVHTTPEYLEFLKIIKAKQIPVSLGQAGQVIKLAEGAEVEVLGPLESYQGETVKDLNAVSLVVLIKYGSTRALFTGDQTIAQEQKLLTAQVNLSAQLLKVAHHGSGAASMSEFLQAVKPDYAVISVGADNRFGHPAVETVRRLQDAGAVIIRTDEAGDVRFISNGQFWLQP